MSILNTYPTNYAWSNRLLDTTYNGPCVTVRRSDGDPLTDPTQVINYVNGVIDQASLETFLGESQGFVTVAHVPQGTMDYIQPDATLQPYINTRQDFLGLAQLTFNSDRQLYIDNAESYDTFSIYMHCQFLGADVPSWGGALRLVGPYGESLNRAELYLKGVDTNADSVRDSIQIWVEGTSTPSQKVILSSYGADETTERLISAKISASGGTASVYYNTATLFENDPIASAGGTGISMVRSVGGFTVHISSFLYYPGTQHDTATRQEIETFLLDEPYVSGPITKDGVLQAGVVVQVTAYDDYTQATGKQEVGNYVTDVDGVISIPNADVPAGKKLLLTPHNEATGVLSSDQAKFVSDTF